MEFPGEQPPSVIVVHEKEEGWHKGGIFTHPPVLARLHVELNVHGMFFTPLRLQLQPPRLVVGCGYEEQIGDA